MNFTRLSLIAIALSTGALQAIAALPDMADSQPVLCSFAANKNIFANNRKGHSAIWTLQNSSALAAPFASTDQNYVNFRKWVSENTNWDAIEILKNNIKQGLEAIKGMNPKDAFVNEILRSNRGEQRIIDGEIGKIRPMSCLEGIPLLELMKVVDLRKNAVEMFVTILKKNTELKVIGDFYFTSDEVAGTDESSAAKKLRLGLMRSGWQAQSNYHNHPFDFRNADIGGEVAPSSPDIESYQKELPPSALISNGIDTIVLEKADYLKLER
jgi:hypothetical protein